MCTVSVFRGDDSLRLTMNRDELRTRAEGEVVRLEHALYPSDALAGGTWIGANDQGAVLSLLNDYGSPQGVPGPSRGQIIPQALRRGSTEDINQWLRGGFEPLDYQPFHLVVCSINQLALWHWNGRDWQSTSIPTSEWWMFSSSGLRTQEVLQGRRTLFESYLSRPSWKEGIPAFHFWQDRQHEEQTFFVDRPAVHTKSIVQFVVSASGVSMRYWDEQSLYGNLQYDEVILPNLGEFH